jgi:hypothetical protein
MTTQGPAHQQWEQFLSPEVTQERLVSASLYIAAFEILKQSIIRRLRDFYLIGFGEGKEEISPDYQKRVLSRNKSAVYASLDWLLESGVISKNDLAIFERVRSARNNITHRLPELVFQGERHGLDERFQELFALVKKIEIWWVVNLDLATDPEYDGKEVDEEKITPGTVLMLQLMRDVASGNDEYLRHFQAEVKSADKT